MIKELSSKNVLFVFAIIVICLIAGIFAYRSQFLHDVIFSALGNDVEIGVTGPEVINAGSLVGRDVSVENKTNQALESVVLTVTYPDGSLSVEDFKSDKKSLTIDLGRMDPGGMSTGTVYAVYPVNALGKGKVSLGVSWKYALSGVVGKSKRQYSFTYGPRTQRHTDATAWAIYDENFFTPEGKRGPMPPRVGVETEYAIVMSVKNEKSPLKNAVMSAKLPPGVRWLGVYSPKEEKLGLAWDDDHVFWDLGDVASSSESRQYAFSVALTPTSEQVGSQAVLLKDIVLLAVDASTSDAVRIDVSDVMSAADSQSTGFISK